jgi:hypothetical protein
MYLFTDADIAKFNGRDILEVQTENQERIERVEKEAEEKAHKNSFWGKLETFVSKIGEYSGKLGHTLNGTSPPPPVVEIEADTSEIVPSDLDASVSNPVTETSEPGVNSAAETSVNAPAASNSNRYTSESSLQTEGSESPAADSEFNF